MLRDESASALNQPNARTNAPTPNNKNGWRTEEKIEAKLSSIKVD